MYSIYLASTPTSIILSSSTSETVQSPLYPSYNLICSSVVNRQISGKDKTHQGTLDGLLHPATTEQDTQQKPQCPGMPTGTLATSRYVGHTHTHIRTAVWIDFAN